jgi:Ca2+-binding RTX toxin-like protein
LRRKQGPQKGGKRMAKRIAVLVAVVGLMMMVFAGAAFAVTRVGDAGPNRLVGTAENDVLKGRAGADTLVGRGDSDLLVGGRGNDQINARESGRAEDDRVDCGPGRDTVLTDNTTEDSIASNCEVVKRG